MTNCKYVEHLLLVTGVLSSTKNARAPNRFMHVHSATTHYSSTPHIFNGAVPTPDSSR
jgi:hypothetical protein